MTRDESLQIVSMILTGWPQAKDMEKEEIDFYARAIQDMSAELTTHAVLKLNKETPYRPSVAELRERVRQERRRLKASEAPPEDPEIQPLPMWVKRWICARMLFKQFGKERDMRRFPEAGDFGDLTQEVMPEGAWAEEAARFDDAEFRKLWTRAIRGTLER